ncbi:MAG TPA: DoxX family protein [Longimicrobium sp.]|jgi:uncharacterized membrane protein YphA (DoxX/SURF4 family)
MTSTTLASEQTLAVGTQTHKASEVLLWGVQVVLALVFLFAGVMKLITPFEVLQAQSTVSVSLLRFIGVCEVLGALGLVLPGLFRIHQFLTPLAAAGLTIIMTGAVVLTALGDVSMAAIPLVVGMLTSFVAHARWQRLPR